MSKELNGTIGNLITTNGSTLKPKRGHFNGRSKMKHQHDLKGKNKPKVKNFIDITNSCVLQNDKGRRVSTDNIKKEQQQMSKVSTDETAIDPQALDFFNKGFEWQEGIGQEEWNKLYRNLRYLEARDFYNKALEISPTYTKAIYNRGISFYLEGECICAIGDLATELKNDMNNIEALYYLSLAFYDLNLKKEAVNIFKKAFYLQNLKDILPEDQIPEINYEDELIEYRSEIRKKYPNFDDESIQRTNREELTIKAPSLMAAPILEDPHTLPAGNAVAEVLESSWLIVEASAITYSLDEELALGYALKACILFLLGHPEQVIEACNQSLEIEKSINGFSLRPESQKIIDEMHKYKAESQFSNMDASASSDVEAFGNDQTSKGEADITSVAFTTTDEPTHVLTLDQQNYGLDPLGEA